jgi:5-formyltetrahydrofolate cyclo-ligase
MWRANLLERRSGMSDDVHRTNSDAVIEHLLADFANLETQRVGLYWPFRREIGLFRFGHHILANGGELSLPVVVRPGLPLEFRAWKPGDPLSRGVYDIPFPSDGEVVRPSVLIVPLLGFDRSGYRLGYGGGYYDRTLAAADPRPLTIGVGFEIGRLETIFPLAHDLPMDAIVTDAGVFRRDAPSV